MKILLSNINNYLGRNLIRYLSGKNQEIHVVIDPGKTALLSNEIIKDTLIHEFSGNNLNSFKSLLEEHKFDLIIQIPESKLQQKTKPKNILDRTVNLTEQLILHARENSISYLYLTDRRDSNPPPIKGKQNRIPDFENLLERSERMIMKQVLYGLHGNIIRAAAVYSPDPDNPFFEIIRLLDRNRLRIPNPDRLIRITNIDLLGSAVKKIIERDDLVGQYYFIADKDPVAIGELTEYLGKLLGKEESGRKILTHIIPSIISILHRSGLRSDSDFRLGEKDHSAEIMQTAESLNLKLPDTIPGIAIVVEFYLKEKT